MAIIQIDVIQFDNGGEPVEANIFYNNVTAEVTFTVSQGVLPSGQLTTEQRGKAAGTVLGTYLNEAATEQRTLTATLTPNYAAVGPAVPVTENPPQCDLALTLSTTNENSQGADDGTATISATSSFAGVLVSINDVDYFATPKTFTGLAPGPYTAYAKDNNGCTQAKQFSVSSFDNPIEGGFAGGLPQVEVLPGKVSRWNAAYNPIVLKFYTAPDPDRKNLRIEIEITTQSGTVVGRWSPSPQGYTRADISAYLQPLVNSIDDFKYNVLNYRDINRAASFEIRYRSVWDGGASDWYSAPQPLYVTYSAKQLGDKYGGNMAEYVPMISGGAVTPASFQWSNTQQETPYEDANLQIKINNEVTVDAFGDENGNFNAAAGLPYSVQAYTTDEPQAPGFLKLTVRKNGAVIFRNQINNEPGASMVYTGITDIGAAYTVEVVASSDGVPVIPVNIPDNSYTPPVTSTYAAKWLTGFPKPRATPGIPFDLSFIFSEYLIGEPVTLQTISLDINKNPIAGGVINSFLLNNDAGYILGSDTGRLIIQQGALPPVSNDGILEQLGINRLMLAGPAAMGVEYFQMQLFTGDAASPNFVTQPILVKLEQLCPGEPYIYIKWLNTLGGWDYWRFKNDNILTLNTSTGISVDRNVFDWENDDTIEDNIERAEVSRVSVGATVSRIELEGLKGLPGSIKIMMLTSLNPIKWQTVIPNTGAFEMGRAKNEFTDIRFTFSLPSKNIQRNNGFTRNVQAAP